VKRWWGVLAAGVLLSSAGVFALQGTTLQSALASRLNQELALAQARGHPASILVMDGDEDLVRDRALRVARDNGETVLAISHETALVVPSAADRSLASPQAWSAVAYNVVAPYLRNDDLPGAAAALVRRYTDELTTRGILDALPPRAPIFLPDIERQPDYPSESWLLGIGLMLMMSAAYRLAIERR
jgi:hypothetical protein